MNSILFTFHFIICIALILLILAQQGKGSEMGVTFSSGSSSSVFGSKGSSGFLVKLTTFLACVFFFNCLMIGLINKAPGDAKLINDIVENSHQ